MLARKQLIKREESRGNYTINNKIKFTQKAGTLVSSPVNTSPSQINKDIYNLPLKQTIMLQLKETEKPKILSKMNSYNKTLN